jgi:hypothetical protein
MSIALVSEQSNWAELIPEPRRTRRLQDKIAIAFHQACDLRDIDTAQALLDTLEFMSERPQLGTARLGRHERDGLVAANERLWHLRHSQGPQQWG